MGDEVKEQMLKGASKRMSNGVTRRASRKPEAAP